MIKVTRTDSLRVDPFMDLIQNVNGVLHFGNQDIRQLAYDYILEQISAKENSIVITDRNGAIKTVLTKSAFNKPFGNIRDSVCEGNDERLSDARKTKLYGTVRETVNGSETTDEEIIGTIRINANDLELDDELEIVSAWSMASETAASKIVRVRLHTAADSPDGTIYGQYTNTDSGYYGLQFYTRIISKRAVDAQEGGLLELSGGGIGVYTAADEASSFVTSSIDTRSDFYILFTTQKEEATDTIKLHNASIKLNKK